MHRLSTSWLCFGVWTAFACGDPAELDESRFPGLNETGYTDGNATAGGTAVQPIGAAASPPVGAAAGSPTPPAAGGTSALPPASAGGGAVAAPSAGGASPAPAGGAAVPAPAAPAPASPAPAGGGATAGGCPSDITVLFNRPIEQGGCNGGSCHVPGATSPDLVSPNPETRLVNVASQCNGRPYIGPDDSFLEDKLVGAPPECGFPMPFFMPQALNATDKACILAWIDEVSGG